MTEIEPANLFITYRRNPEVFITSPVGPSPTLMVAYRTPEASVTTTLLLPMPVTYARPLMGCHAMPRGSPSERARCGAGMVGEA